MIKLQFTGVQNDFTRTNVERFTRNLEQVFEQYQKLMIECFQFCEPCKNASAIPLLQISTEESKNHKDVSILQQTPSHKSAEGIALTLHSNSVCGKEFQSNSFEATIKEADNEKIIESPLLKKRKKQRKREQKSDMETSLEIRHQSSRRNILSELCVDNYRVPTSPKINDNLKLLEEDTLSSLRSPKENQKLITVQDPPMDDEIIENSPKQLSLRKKRSKQKLKGRQLLKDGPQSKADLNIEKNVDNIIEIILLSQDSGKTQAESSNSQDQRKEDPQENSEINNDVTFFELGDQHPRKQLQIHSNTKQKLKTSKNFDQSFDIVPSTKKAEESGNRPCRAERTKTEGHDCWCCHEYYQDFEDSDERRKAHQKLSSRHRGSVLKRSRKDSQEFWNPLFPETESVSFEND